MSKQVLVVAEGRTEETFINQVLAPALEGRDLYLRAMLVTTKKTGHRSAAADALIQGGYMEFEDSYMTQDVTDNPYVITSITFSDGTTKRIEHYHGDLSAPEELTALEELIDDTANVAQWVGKTG